MQVSRQDKNNGGHYGKASCSGVTGRCVGYERTLILRRILFDLLFGKIIQHGQKETFTPSGGVENLYSQFIVQNTLS